MKQQAILDAVAGKMAKPEDLSTDMLETMLVGVSALLAGTKAGSREFEDTLAMLHTVFPQEPQKDSTSRFQSECLAAICDLLGIGSGPGASGSYMDPLWAQSVIKKLSLPMLQHIVTVLVRRDLSQAAMEVVQHATMLRPADALLQAWQKTLQIASSDAHIDATAVLAALQPFQPKTAASMADAARLRFHSGETAEGLADLS